MFIITTDSQGISIPYDITGYATGTGATAGSVIINARDGSITTGNVNLTGRTGAAGGLITAASLSGGLFLGRNISNDAMAVQALEVQGISVSGDTAGGRIILTAGTTIKPQGYGSSAQAVLNFNSSSAHGAGGDITVSINGSDIDGVALSAGTVNTSGTSGGNLVIVDFDPSSLPGHTESPFAVMPPGSLSLGAVNTEASAASGFGGEVAISTPGQVTIDAAGGSLKTDNTTITSATSNSTGGGMGGDVFISSGAGITIGHVASSNSTVAFPYTGPDNNPYSGAVILYTNGDVIAGGTDYAASHLPIYSNTTPNDGHELVYYNAGINTAQQLTGSQTISVQLQAGTVGSGPAPISTNLTPGGINDISLGSGALNIENLVTTTGAVQGTSGTQTVTVFHNRLLVPVVALSGVLTTGDVTGLAYNTTNLPNAAIPTAINYNSASAVVLAGAQGIKINGNVSSSLAGSANAQGQGGQALLVSAVGSIDVTGYVTTEGNTGVSTSSGGKLDILAPNSTVTIGANGGSSGNSILTDSGAAGGNLTIVAAQGIVLSGGITTGSTGSGGNVTLIDSVGAINIGANSGLTSIDTHSNFSNAGDINVFVGEVLNGGINTSGNIEAFSASATCCNGGSLNVIASQGLLEVANNIDLNLSSASLDSQNHAGNVNVVVPGVALLDFEWTINAFGPNGGSVHVVSGGDFIRNVTDSQGTTSIKVSATSTSGQAGSISIVTNSPDPFGIDCGACTGFEYNHVTGSIIISGSGQGGSILLGNESGPLIINNFSQALGISSVNGQLVGGSVTLIGSYVEISGIAVNSNGVPSLDVEGQNQGGTVTIITSDGSKPLIVGPNAQASGSKNFIDATLDASSSGGTGGTITLNSAGGVQVDASDLNVQGAVNGGTIKITTNTTTPLVIGNDNTVTQSSSYVYGNLTASNTGHGATGNGGSIIIQNQSGPVQIDSSETISVQDNNTSGNGGLISVTGTSIVANGILNANGGSTATSTNSANGGGILLLSTGGGVTVTGTVTATGPEANTGSIEVIASGGDINTPANGGAVFDAGNTITMSGTNNITIGAGTQIISGVANGTLSDSKTEKPSLFTSSFGGVVIQNTSGAITIDSATIKVVNGDLQLSNGIVSSGTPTGLDVGSSTLDVYGGNLKAYGQNSGGVDIGSGTNLLAIAQFASAGTSLHTSGGTNGLPLYYGGTVAIIGGNEASPSVNPDGSNFIGQVFTSPTEKQQISQALQSGDLGPLLTGLHSLRVSSGIEPGHTAGLSAQQLQVLDGGSVYVVGHNTISSTTVFKADGGVIYIDPSKVRARSVTAIAPPLAGGSGPGSTPFTPISPIIPVTPPQTPELPETLTPVLPAPEAVQTDQIKNMPVPTAVIPPILCTPTAIDTNGPSGSMFVAGGACQPFSFESGDDGTVVVGSGGTVFGPETNRTILLKEGKLLTVAGKQGVVVETAHGKVHIPADTATIVQQKPSGVVRIANLSGESADVSVTHGSQTKTLTANPGEEVVLADASLSDEELIDVDGVDREPISGTVAVTGMRIEKNKFDRKMMADREQLLLCNTGCFTVSMRRKFENVKRNVTGSSPLISGPAGKGKVIGSGAPAGNGHQKLSVTTLPAQADRTPTTAAPAAGDNNDRVSNVPEAAGSDEHLVEIGFVQGSAPGSRMMSSLFRLATDSAIIRHSGQAQITMERPGVVSLKQGETLLEVTKPTVIKSGDYRIALDAGTVALVSLKGGVIKVRNLYEGSAKSIHAVVEGKKVDVAVGQELLMGPNDGSVLRVLNSESIGRRNLRSFDLEGGSHQLIRCEFSLVSLMGQIDVLSRVKASANGSDHDLINRLIKMAAIMSQVTAGHGSFASFQK